jgi:hypothetical protein
MQMSLKLIARRTKFDIAVTLGLLASSAILASAPAYAGACPADQVAENAMEPGATMPEGVTDEVLSSIDLSYKANEAVAEFGALAHWWKNNGNTAAVLYSADILPPEMPDDHAM